MGEGTKPGKTQTPAKRELAVKFGAVEIERRELGRKISDRADALREEESSHAG